MGINTGSGEQGFVHLPNKENENLRLRFLHCVSECVVLATCDSVCRNTAHQREMTLESVVSVPIRSPIHFRLANRCQILDQTDKLSTLQTNHPKCIGCIPNMIYTMM